MSDPFVGEIRLFAGTFAPQDWAFCNGQLLSIADYDALFSLIGTTYGGDGQTTFAVPDLRGRVPIHQGAGPGLTPRAIGESFGVETVTLGIGQIPSHSHGPLRGSTDAATATNPNNQVLASGLTLYRNDVPNQVMDPSAVSITGNSQPHDNMMPFIGINFIISLAGIFPSRN